MDYQSACYKLENVVVKYIGYIGDLLILREVNNKNQTIKSYIIKESNISDDVLEKCKALKGQAFNQVKLEN